MSMHGGTGDTGGVAVTAADTARGLERGDYLSRWDDEEQPGGILVHEVKAALRDRDLTLVSDDRGLRVVAREVQP